MNESTTRKEIIDKKLHRVSWEVNVGAPISSFVLNEVDTMAIGTIVGRIKI